MAAPRPPGAGRSTCQKDGPRDDRFRPTHRAALPRRPPAVRIERPRLRREQVSETTPSRFNCASCGKDYRWKPEIAGKRAKCKCGAEVAVPAKDPGPARSAAKAAPGARPPGAPRPAAATRPAPPPPPPAGAGGQSFEDVFAEAAAEAERAAAANEAAGKGGAAAGDEFDVAPPPPPPAGRPAAQTVAPPGGYAGAYAGAIPRRAKIDNTSPVETYHNRWRGLGYAFGGLLLCAYAVFEFVSLQGWEETGGRKRMR